MSDAPGPIRAVVTGATSGLGRALAVLMGRRGWRVAVTGRRAERLEETAKLVREAGGEALALPGSVTDDGEVRAHYAAIAAAWGGLDWAVLNAGISAPMNARAFSAEAVRRTFDVNVLGAARWLEAVIPGMAARGSGLIAGISSLAALRGLPRTGPYCASKAALLTLLESARVDLRGTGVAVCAVCPGFVKSEITNRRDPRAMPFLMETEDGAAAVLRGLDARRRVVHFPWPLSYPARFLWPALPGFLYDPIAALLGTLKDRASPS
ncbi:MAG: SDR family NAD(P)-dependent oxidoreductase [Elusimicrobia bacterium]|nr:SDR family NAD(P)-dependent oxidoreductase [Elusimicrobiota bacterium]